MRVAWTAPECATASGRVRCRSADGLARGRFTPARDGTIRFALQLRRLDLSPPFAPPIRTRITNGAIDRVGTAADCTSTSTMMKCRP